MKTKLTQPLYRVLGVFSLLLMLSACDGGIFGTGSGTEIDFPPIDGDGNNNGEQNIPDTSTDNTGDSQGNSSVSGTATQPLFNVINATDNVVNVWLNQAEQPAFDDVGVAAYEYSKNAALDLGINQLSVRSWMEDTAYIATDIELSVDASTITTLLIRNDQGIDVLSLPTEVQSSDPSLVKVRVLQASTFVEPNSLAESINLTATFTLQPTGDNPGGAQTDFPNVSYYSVFTDYQELTAGSYNLVDSLSRLDPTALTFIGGKAYTLIMVSNPNPAVWVIDDSEFQQD